MALFVATVKKRPVHTTSERQLLSAFLETGRTIGLADLRAWRKAGLLPPLASHGTGAGRSYYWCEPDIQLQAERVYDSLQRHGRIDEALITIWLAGFDVPLERLRRAWLNRGKMRRGLKSHVPTDTSSARPNMGGLLELGFATLVSLVDPDPRHKRMVLEILSGGANKEIAGDGMVASRHLVGMAAVYGPLLESSNLMATATELELVEARRHLHRLIREPDLEVRGTDSDAAANLLLFILGLVRSGQGAALEPLSEKQEKKNKKGQDRLSLVMLH